MKKFLLSFSLILAFSFYVVFQRARTENRDTLSAPADKNKRVVLTPAPVPATSSEPPGFANPASKMFKDGEFIGNIADAYYGNVQAKAFIINGKIADVLFLNHPNEREKSIEINGRAMPLLKIEAIQAQSAEVDIVSGATLTSQAFKESLANALAQAKN